ncbi:hypothetical protein C8J56DRAFT_1164083, partial [Mycena floridula]
MSNPSSCSLSDEEIALVQYKGTGLVIPNTLGYGIYLPLAVMSIYVLFRRGLPNSRARSVLFAFLVVMLVVATATFATHVKMAKLSILLLLGPNTGQPSESVTRTSYNQLVILSIVLEGIIFFMSDLIVVWRAWVICNRRNVKLLLTVCITGSLGGIIFDSVRNTQIRLGTAPKTSLESLGIYLPLIFTNVVATLAIALEAWQSRASLLRHLNRASSTSRPEKILLILVESGILYWVFWIVDITLRFTSVDYIYFANFIPYGLAGYPSGIVILVTRELTPEETAFQKPSSANLSHNNSTHLSSYIQ